MQSALPPLRLELVRCVLESCLDVTLASVLYFAAFPRRVLRQVLASGLACRQSTKSMAVKMSQEAPRSLTVAGNRL